MQLAPPLLSVRNVTKRFAGVEALANVSVDFRAGEIHCLLGENGAGKSTLMNVLDGVIRPDAGEILVDGERVDFASPVAARAAGIGMVHQHFTLIEAMSVAENLALSVTAAGEWRLDRAAIAARAQAFAARIGLAIADPEQPVHGLSVGARQRIEILKALMAAGKVLILDEPTAVLTPREVDQLFEMLRELRAEQRLVIFITHKLREVKEIADRVTIMRRGRVLATYEAATVSETALAEEMIGEVLEISGERRPVQADAAVAVEIRDLSALGDEGVPALDEVGFSLHAGEILGIAGVDGNGQRELFEVLVGLRASTGYLRIAEREIERLTPQKARAAGVASIPPDRHREGLALTLSVAESFLLNATLLERFTRRGFLDHAAARDLAADSAARFDIRFADLDQSTSNLSGGNQQRIIVARELSQQPRVLIAVNPTRGLDVQAMHTVANALRSAAAAGCAVLLISTDLDELLDLSDRISVLFRGRLSPPLDPPFSTATLGQLMAGTQS